MEVLEELLTKNENYDMNVKLQHHASNGRIDECMILLKAKTNVNDQNRWYGWTALYSCVAGRQKNEHILELLLQFKADPTIVSNVGWSPLHECCYWGDINNTKLLLEAKSNPFLTTNDDRTCLGIAILNDQHQIVQYLKEFQYEM